MGKIIKKRIEYGGSSNSAENVKYNDTKNVKEAIDEVKSELADVNSNLEWKLLRTVTGNTIVNLPEAYNELLIKVRGNNDKSYVSVWHLIPAMLSETEQYFPIGASRGGNQTTYGYENRIKVTSSTVNIHVVYINGIDHSLNSVMEVYYR